MDNKITIANGTESNEKTECTPFVNEECGDTMWDEVLKNMEEADKESLDKLNGVL